MDARPVLFTSGELAARLKSKLIGPADLPIRGLEALPYAGPADLSFLRSPRFAHELAASKCGAVLVGSGSLDPESAGSAYPGKALIFVENADETMIGILELAAPKPSHRSGVHPSALVDPAARIDPTACIGPNAVIGPRCEVGEGTVLVGNNVLGEGVRIGKHCILHPGVMIQHECRVMDRVIMHPGVVIGADGFGYRPAPGGKGLLKVPHIGSVVIENDVEIGANTTIDRGKFGATTIGAGTKIDNLVQIGHNCRIGRSCIICGCCAIAGSVTLGDGVTLAGAVGVADNRTIGAGAIIGARSAVMRDVPPGETWLGQPAMQARTALRFISFMDKLPDLMHGLRHMQRDLKQKRQNGEAPD